MKDWFKKEKKKEKLKWMRDGGKKQNFKLPKDVKDIVITAGGIILLAEAVDLINS